MEASRRRANIQIRGILDKEKYKNKDLFIFLLFLCIFEISQIKILRQFKISEKIMMIYFMTLKKKKNLRLKCCKVMLFLQWGEIRKTLVSLKLKTAKNEEKNLKS